MKSWVSWRRPRKCSPVTPGDPVSCVLSPAHWERFGDWPRPPELGKHSCRPDWGERSCFLPYFLSYSYYCACYLAVVRTAADQVTSLVSWTTAAAAAVTVCHCTVEQYQLGRCNPKNTNMQLIFHFKHHVWNNHQFPKLGQISFIKIQKGFRKTKEEIRDRKKKPKNEIQKS